jgi:ATP-dependent helicase HrpB
MTEPLPIYEIEAALMAQLRTQTRVILQAPTGSGKSTQVPQMLLRNGTLGNGQVVILQPRRLAARLLAARVAQEYGCELGAEVGYQVRFDHRTGPRTRIRYVTEGILLRQMLQDPRLPAVQVLIFDEFHERHLDGDISLARALELQKSLRPDLRILVMSATLEAGPIEEYLSPCAVLRAEGRTFPVQVEYAPYRTGSHGPPVWERAAEMFRRRVQAGDRGDVLVFMPGGFEIQQTIEALRPLPESRGYLLLPLHGELAARDQDAAVTRYEQPKVVVSTNVAETSITIDGIRLVIDSGLARMPRYDPHRGINTLLIEKISRASADQRTGRAGRTAPGACIRLWSHDEQAERPAHELPEIQRLELAEAVLMLKAADVTDLRQFPWLDPPLERSLAQAEALLSDLGALDRNGAITSLGRRMLSFPLHPRYARMLLAAQDFGCVHDAAVFAALTQGRDLFTRRADKQVAELRDDLFGQEQASDFWVLRRAWSYASEHAYRLDACRRAGIHALTARQVGPLLDHFLRIAQQEGLDTRPAHVSDQALQKCILTGFSDRVARRLDAGTLRCEMVHGRRGVLARDSVVHHSSLFVAAEVREVQGRDGELSTILSLATAIEADWLRELFPEDFSVTQEISYDSSAKRIVADELLRFRGLALSSRRMEPPPADAAARLLAQEVIAGRLILKQWNHATDQWLIRLNCLGVWCPELELPPVTEADRHHLIEQICHGAISYKDLKDRPVAGVVRSWLSPAQQDLLDRHAPERVSLPNGRQPKVTYALDGPPHIALRIQELYDVKESPRVALGRVTVVVHILAPNMRPVQVTQDLAAFWSVQYPKVKQELHRKYPKHEWR